MNERCLSREPFFVAALFCGKPFLGCQIGDKLIISHSLANLAGNREIRLLLLGSSWLPCLGIGVILAVFQTSGNFEAKSGSIDD